MTFLLRLLAFLFLFYFLRRVLQVLLPGLFSRSEANEPQPASREVPPQIKHGTMEKDPICGTYVDVSTSLKISEGTATKYFCSADCLNKFKKGAAR